MPISKSEELYSLIKSLSKAEKRNFKLYAHRLQGNEGGTLFLKLFELMDKQKVLDDRKLISGLDNIKASQFSNTKRHLYTQLITSLRLIHKQKRYNIQVRESLDFAYILYGKGLYLQSLKLLQIAKRMAQKHHLNYSYLTIVEFEKFIESRHITRSKQNRDKELIQEATDIEKTISLGVTLSNLRLRLHGKYIRYGHIKNEAEKKEVTKFFETEINKINQADLGVIETVFYYQSYVWYYYILRDFDACLEYALKWVNLLKAEPEMLWRDVDLFMRGYHYVVTAAYQGGNKAALLTHQKDFEDFRNNEYKKFNKNSQITAFIYVHMGRLNAVILNADFEKGVQLIPRTLARIKKYGDSLDEHRILVMYYKIAWIYLGNNQPDKAIEYLNLIVNQDIKNLRQDIQGYARLLFLMCHYDLGNHDLLEYLVKTFKPYFVKHAQDDFVQLEILKCMQELCVAPIFDRIDIYGEYLRKFESIEGDVYARKSITYLDIISWLRAKQRKLPLAEIIKLRFVG